MIHGLYYKAVIEATIKLPKIKNEDQYTDHVADIINYFDSLRRDAEISKVPMKITFTRRKLITDRLKELKQDDAIRQIKNMILVKFTQWANKPSMRMYLKPETLFRPSHFAKYLDEVNEITPEGWTKLKTKTAKVGQNEMSWT